MKSNVDLCGCIFKYTNVIYWSSSYTKKFLLDLQVYVEHELSVRLRVTSMNFPFFLDSGRYQKPRVLLSKSLLFFFQDNLCNEKYRIKKTLDITSFHKTVDFDLLSYYRFKNVHRFIIGLHHLLFVLFLGDPFMYFIS